MQPCYNTVINDGGTTMKRSKWIRMALLMTAALVGCTGTPSGAPEPTPEPTPEPIAVEGTTLVFDSFDGGGPSYSVHLDDPTLVTVTSRIDYRNPDHNEIDGAAFSVTFTFTGNRAGETGMTVSVTSPLEPDYEIRYAVSVDEALCVTLTETGRTDPYADDIVEEEP